VTEATRLSGDPQHNQLRDLTGSTVNEEQGNHMTSKSHLAELERRHHALEKEIDEALAHSSTDDLKISELKRHKLQLKDEIERFRHDIVL
jgi:hypothetical protein